MLEKDILIDGGSGLLGLELKKLIPNALFPPSIIFDVTDSLAMERYINQNNNIKVLVHCAAITAPPKIEENPYDALNVNIVGTANIVKLCSSFNLKLIYISTDYVFDGVVGNYRESDSVYPTNKYAWSKLGGECAVKMYNNSVIVRLSFGKNEFPYDGAYDDQWTSREKVSDTAIKLKNIIQSDFIGTIHIGSEKRTVYEYAKSISPEKEIKKLSIKSRADKIPQDTSLNTNLYKSLFENSVKGTI